MDDIRVARVIDLYKVVINKGLSDGIKPGYTFMIYALDDEPIIDPITKENLGELEVVKGRAKVVHLQERTCTIESISETKAVKSITKERGGNLWSGLNSGATITEEWQPPTQLPFDDVEIGDHVRIIT